MCFVRVALQRLGYQDDSLFADNLLQLPVELGYSVHTRLDERVPGGARCQPRESATRCFLIALFE